MATKKPLVDPKKGIYKIKMYNPKTDYKEYKYKPYVPPPYEDPLTKPVLEYHGNLKVPEYKPYEGKPTMYGYREYKGPLIDPLTGKPYNRGQVNHEEPASDDDEEEISKEAQKKKKPVPKVYIPLNPLNPMFGNPTFSVQRTVQINDNLDF